MSDPRRPVSPTTALLGAARQVADRLSHLSRDPDVRREAESVAQAVGRLLEALKRTGRK
ncbi:hypothetical protein [Deinococcus koreensis]|uniref:hypothetical protein n=1 Tax=Deinococcus koreensis TaxID=2054903 RepID=UPI0013FDCAE2|nr:hypothetical protein [Deinococcus koreensis]